MSASLRNLALVILLVPAFGQTAPGGDQAGPLFRHSAAWVTARLTSMMAVDDAYLWHDVLGGRVIHQNSSADPPTEPLEGNFHTQQQSKFALAKMHLWELTGRRDEKLLDDARTLLEWVVKNGIDPERGTFYLKYNIRKDQWEKGFYPEFNLINVAALVRYHTIRPTPAFAAAAERALPVILATEAFREDAGKNLYGSGYIALMLLDLHQATGEARYLELARQVVSLANRRLHDDEHGAWVISWSPTKGAAKHGTKYTHVIADLVQASYQLYLRGQGSEFLAQAEDGLAFLIRHNRDANGLWYRHNTRDGQDPSAEPADGGDGGPGSVHPYDRQMQVVVALCHGWEATRKTRYLSLIDDTLAAMETSHKMVYPAGINYGYMGRSSQNTWCHLWGLAGFTAVAALQQAALTGGLGPWPVAVKADVDTDQDGVTDSTEGRLGLDPKAREAWVEVYRLEAPQEGDKVYLPVALSVCSLGGPRVAFRAEMPADWEPGSGDLVLYLDVDRDRATGRPAGSWGDSGGTDLSLLLTGSANLAVFRKEARPPGAPATRGAAVGRTVYLVDDLALQAADGQATLDLKPLAHQKTGAASEPGPWVTVTFPVRPATVAPEPPEPAAPVPSAEVAKRLGVAPVELRPVGLDPDTAPSGIVSAAVGLAGATALYQVGLDQPANAIPWLVTAWLDADGLPNTGEPGALRRGADKEVPAKLVTDGSALWIAVPLPAGARVCVDVTPVAQPARPLLLPWLGHAAR